MKILFLYIIYRYMHCFFDVSGVRKSKELLAYGLYLAAAGLIRDLLGLPYIVRSFMVDVLSVYLLSQIYPGKQGKKLLATALVCSMNTFCKVVAFYALGDLALSAWEADESRYIAVLLCYICQRIIEKSGIKNMREDISLKHWDLLIFLPSICVLSLIALVVSGIDERYVVVTVGVGMILLNLIVFYICDEMVGAYTKLEERALVERQLESYSRQLELVMRSEEKVRGLRHDLKHHLGEILMMAEGKRSDDIKEYIKNMQLYMTNEDEYVSSGNADIDSLINLMLNKAKKELGNVSCKVSVPQGLDIPPFDWNIIMGNLLDNAIHAARGSDAELLQVRINYQRGVLFINVKNSYQGTLVKTTERYLSTKAYDRADSLQAHGIGLDNVRKIVEKYNGSMEISDADGMFDVGIMMYVAATGKSGQEGTVDGPDNGFRRSGY